MKSAIFLLFSAALAVLLAQAPQNGSDVANRANPKGALNKAALETYLRHLFVWSPPIEMTIGDPQPGPMDGFYQVKVRGSQGTASQEETFYVSKDGQKILRGTIYDVNQNPFKTDLDRIHTEYQPNIGTPGAPVVIAEFSDFQCPYCREEAKSLRANLLAAYPKEVRLYYLDFPLEPVHPWAKSAAMIGRCIFHQNASVFWDYHDWIFEHQNEITPENLKQKVLDFAKIKSLAVDQLSKCIDSRVTEEEVNKTQAEGVALEVNSTPTLFINGRRMVGAVPWPELKRVIDYEIGYQKTAKNAGEDCGCTVKLPEPGASAPATNARSPKK